MLCIHLPLHLIRTFKGTFMGLNAVRFFSVVGLLLVFSSSIFVMVNDIRAVNDFMAAKQAGNANMTNCDYIE
jgi:hypothetical protein